MTDSFRFLIRDGLERDIPSCLDLDSAYETQYVWQMTLRPEPQQHSIEFKTERLPRMMDVVYPASETRLRLVLRPEQCFLIASAQPAPDQPAEAPVEATNGSPDAPESPPPQEEDRNQEILGFLVMRHDPAHRIAWVQDIVVARPFRRRRIGTRLLRVARQWAEERGARQFTVETQTQNFPAIAFCQKFGLTFCGFNDQYFPDQDIAVFFGQPLGSSSQGQPLR